MKQGPASLLFGGVLLSPFFLWVALPGRFSLWPLLFICLVPLFLWLADTKTLKQAAGRGVLAGIIIYALQLYWIVSVLIKFGGLPWFVAAPALLLLSLYMSLYLGVFSGCFFLCTRQKTFPYLLIFLPAVWVGLDWLRSWLFGGFPWMDLGYGFWSVPAALQAADIFGHHGYTFLVVLINFVIFAIINKNKIFSRSQQLVGIVLVLMSLVGVTVYSFLKWGSVQEQMAQADQAIVGMVQGNVRQGRKWSPALRAKTVADYIDLSMRLDQDENVSLIVWPETAMPFYVRNNALFDPAIRFVKNSQVPVLTGAPWYEIIDWEKKLIQYFNSAVLVKKDGDFGGLYHKSHLVPYGEYVPLKKYMPFIAPLVQSVGDFTAGTVETPVAVDDHLRLGVLICYESIFASISRRWVMTGANLLVNLTNDAWYGKSSAPYQSWAMTVYRSVETRRCLVRSANTGISGMIDPLGRVRVQSELFVPWARTASVQLMSGETPFVRWGWMFAPICGLLGLIYSIAMFIFHRHTTNKS